jgi:antitoxin MazE
MEVKVKKLILKPVNIKPRSVWEEALKKMSSNKEDRLLMPEDAGSKEFDWQW